MTDLHCQVYAGRPRMTSHEINCPCWSMIGLPRPSVGWCAGCRWVVELSDP